MAWLDRGTLMVTCRLRQINPNHHQPRTSASRTLSMGQGPVPRVRAPYRDPLGLSARDADHARLCGTARGRHHAGMPVRLRAGGHQSRAEPDGRTVQVMRMPMRKEERKEGCHGR